MRFLCIPCDIMSLDQVAQEAEAQKASKDDLASEMAKRHLKEISTKKLSPLYQLLDQLYLSEWADIWFKLDINFDCFGIQDVGSGDERDRKYWEDKMAIYWRRVMRHAEAVGKDAPMNDEDPITKVKRNMVKKIEWIRSGHILPQYHGLIHKLLIANRYIFGCITQFFQKEGKMSNHLLVQDALKEVCEKF